jgi:hypothetical protein
MLSSRMMSTRSQNKPGQPGKPVASNISSTSCTISWAASTGVGSIVYDLYWDGVLWPDKRGLTSPIHNQSNLPISSAASVYVIARIGSNSSIASEATLVTLITIHPQEVFFLNFENSLTDLSKGATATILPAGGTIANVVTSGIKHDGSCSGYFGTHYLRYMPQDIFNIGTGDFTFQCWFFPSSGQPAMTNGFVPLFGGTNYGNTVCFWIPASDSIYWYVPSGVCQTTAKVTKDVWNHIRVVRHLGRVYIFINGTLGSPVAGSACPLTNLSTSWSAGFFIAAEPTQPRYFRGYMDSFQAFNASLGISNFTPVERN